MYYYVRPFNVDMENKIINDGEECYEFSEQHKNYLSMVSKYNGSIINSNLLRHFQFKNCPYEILIPQDEKYSISEIIIKSDIDNNIGKLLTESIKSDTGNSLTILLYQDINEYLDNLNQEQNSDYLMGAFLTNEQLNISHLVSQKDHTPCLKCHFYNVIGDYTSNVKAKNEWQQFFSFMMKNDFGSLSSRELMQNDKQYISSILYSIIMTRFISGYNNNQKSISPFMSYIFHIKELITHKSKMYWNDSCGCS
ncbi:hypothetical protein [Photorhabdus stackebrandtii]|uniref:Uncharacterized protein n=1 Tax=Photorhabdus stackebrandtii TaxID=1123042 RepID=A0A7X5TLZ0_9GAMM|nr:hypothetical protein [Photorhabdus stackebrandtii]NHB98551.1 hypothetical protein [Photorhabdus stackebrandtii]